MFQAFLTQPSWLLSMFCQSSSLCLGYLLRWYWWRQWRRSYLKLSKVVVKSLNGSQHIGAASAYIFLGAKSEDLHKSPLFVWAALASVVPFIFALALYKFLKARWWRKGGCVATSDSGGMSSHICGNIGTGIIILRECQHNFVSTGSRNTRGYKAQTQHPGWRVQQMEWNRFFPSAFLSLPLLPSNV